MRELKLLIGLVVVILSYVYRPGLVAADEVLVTSATELQAVWERDGCDDIITLDENIHVELETPFRQRTQPVTIIGNDVTCDVGDNLQSSSVIKLGGMLSFEKTSSGHGIQAGRIEVCPDAVVAIAGIEAGGLMDTKQLDVRGSLAVEGSESTLIFADNIFVDNNGILEGFGGDEQVIFEGHGIIEMTGNASMELTGGTGAQGVFGGNYKKILVGSSARLQLGAVGVVLDLSDRDTVLTIENSAELRLSGYGQSPLIACFKQSRGGISIRPEATIIGVGKSEKLFDLREFMFVKVERPKMLNLENKRQGGRIFETGAARYEFFDTTFHGANEKGDTFSIGPIQFLCQKGGGKGKLSGHLLREYESVKMMLNDLVALRLQNESPLPQLKVSDINFGKVALNEFMSTGLVEKSLQQPISLEGLDWQNCQLLLSCEGGLTARDITQIQAEMFVNGSPLSNQATNIKPEDGNLHFKIRIPMQQKIRTETYRTTITYKVVQGPGTEH
jgi:hypothetical protein